MIDPGIVSKSNWAVVAAFFSLEEGGGTQRFAMTKLADSRVALLLLRSCVETYVQVTWLDHSHQKSLSQVGTRLGLQYGSVCV